MGKVSDITEVVRLVRAFVANPDSVSGMATLVSKTGSSYRSPGARMGVLSDGSTIGTISGGCLEFDVAQRILTMRKRGVSWELETIDTRPVFGCEGSITLFLESWDSLHNNAAAWVYDVDRAIRDRSELTLECWFAAELADRGTRLLVEDQVPSQGVFVQRLGLLPRVIVVGGHADVRPVLLGVESLGWQAIQCLPGSQRSGWTSGGADCGCPAYALDAASFRSEYLPDARTAVVIMTHNIGRDASYAYEVLQGDYGYVGLLGSLQRRGEVVESVLTQSEGMLLDRLERLYCPIGLDLGSETQEEIALSIVAEIKAAFSERSGQSLRTRVKPIHG